MSLGDEPGIVAAVRSVLGAAAGVELVVVNSGGGDPAARLKAAGLDVPVHTFEERLPAGRVRNIGIEVTSAPIVAFLASDCTVAEGWIERRLEYHREHEAVASAMGYGHAGSNWARAYHLYRFASRSVHSTPDTRALYGVSYSRSLLDGCGGFRDDLWVAEDTELNQRISATTEIAWAPDVVTFHNDPESLPAALRDLRDKVVARRWFLTRMDEPMPRRRVVFEGLWRYARARRSLVRATPASFYEGFVTHLWLLLYLANHFVTLFTTLRRARRLS